MSPTAKGVLLLLGIMIMWGAAEWLCSLSW